MYNSSDSTNPSKCYGAFLYPDPVTVHDSNEKLSSVPSHQSRKISFEYILNDGRVCLVPDDGFIGIVTQDAEEALALLNSIFATGLTFGIASDFLSVFDLCGFEYDQTNEILHITTLRIPSARTPYSLLRDDPDCSRYPDWKELPRKLISISQCKSILDRAIDYHTDVDARKDLRLVAEGYALLNNKSYMGSFLHAWIVIEIILGKLNNQQTSGIRQNSGAGQIATNIKSIIDNLANLGVINSRIETMLQKLRKKRNRIIHVREEASWNEAAGCLDLAAVLLKKPRTQKCTL